jgi:hypothetical protein
LDLLSISPQSTSLLAVIGIYRYRCLLLCPPLTRLLRPQAFVVLVSRKEEPELR